MQKNHKKAEKLLRNDIQRYFDIELSFFNKVLN